MERGRDGRARLCGYAWDNVHCMHGCGVGSDTVQIMEGDVLELLTSPVGGRVIRTRARTNSSVDDMKPQTRLSTEPAPLELVDP
jgi:hypothetical protein